MVLNATFNKISIISWLSVLLVEEIGVPGENHRPFASNWPTLLHNVVSSTPHHMCAGFELATLVVIDTDCICNCKSNYHTITTTTTLTLSIRLGGRGHCNPNSFHIKYLTFLTNLVKDIMMTRNGKKKVFPRNPPIINVVILTRTFPV